MSDKITLAPARGLQIPEITRRSFELRPIGLKVLRAPTFEEAEALGHFIVKVHGGIAWIAGDWANTCEDRFGEESAQLLDATGWEYETLQQYRRVCAAVPYERRQADLSFAHHREVADLKTEAQQLRWLGKAREENWSSARLRRELNKSKDPEKAKLWVLVECKSPADQEALIERLTVEGRTCKAVER